jgi:hypothetical protein
MKPRYFRPQEVSGLSERLVEMLDNARHIAGVKFHITSGKRTKAHTERLGGSTTSLHDEGLAADLRSLQGTLEREKMVFGLGAAGFKQIGLYNSHIHVELDPKDTYAIWHGTSH